MEKIKNDIGKLIFLERTKHKITQEELSKGICSISYLSKLENNKLEASKEILDMLCKKLNININHNPDQFYRLKLKLEKLYNLINHKNKLEATKLMNDLIADNINDSIEITYEFELLNFRYMIFSDDLVEAEKKRKYLSKFKKNFSNEQMFLYLYFSGLLYYQLSEYNKSLQYLKRGETIGINSNIISSHYYLYFHLSLVYSSVQKSYLAINYANSFLEYIQKNGDLNRIIDVQQLLAINYSRNVQFKEALTIFENSLELAIRISSSSLIADIMHNIGCLYMRMNNPASAAEFLEKSLKLRKQKNEAYLNTVCQLSKVYLSVKKTTKARNLIMSCINSQKSINKNFINLKILSFSLIKNEASLLDFLVNIAIPYLEKKDDSVMLCQIYEKTAEVYYEINQYKKSSEFFKKALSIKQDFSF